MNEIIESPEKFLADIKEFSKDNIETIQEKLDGEVGTNPLDYSIIEDSFKKMEELSAEGRQILKTFRESKDKNINLLEQFHVVGLETGLDFVLKTRIDNKKFALPARIKVLRDRVEKKIKKSGWAFVDLGQFIQACRLVLGDIVGKEFALWILSAMARVSLKRDGIAYAALMRRVVTISALPEEQPLRTSGLQLIQDFLILKRTQVNG